MSAGKDILENIGLNHTLATPMIGKLDQVSERNKQKKYQRRINPAT